MQPMTMASNTRVNIDADPSTNVVPVPSDNARLTGSATPFRGTKDLVPKSH